ncbi:MAG: hypothetical protein ABW079_01835 [Sedimenticola sp.]
MIINKPACAAVISLYALLPQGVSAQEGTDIGESDEEIIILDDSGPGGSGDEVILVDEPVAEDEILIPASDEEVEIQDDAIVIETPEEETETVVIDEGQPEDVATAGEDSSGVRIAVDDLRLEYSILGDSNEPADTLQFLHGAFSAEWDVRENWEVRIAARLDSHHQSGNPSVSDTKLDYGETYIRYRGEQTRVTFGAQTVLWGRIDEVPPTDRHSTSDMTRFILDDLQDRRRARPMLRVESFRGNSKYDFVLMPTFRGAELPDVDSIWYPIDRDNGKLLGIESSPAMTAVVSGANIDDDAPEQDGGFGFRYSRTTSDLDYALSIQYGRQTTPYFSYDAATTTFKAQYPRAWTLGGDLGFEAAGATWRFEASHVDLVPSTRPDLSYTEVKGVNWAAGVEFYPGDSDTRVNLQLVGTNLYDTPTLLDRTEIYSFNGSVEMPFAQDRWRANMRFFLGLDKKDVYLNPEIAFLGWEPHELYLQLHYFDGANGTVGDFHQDHSMLTLGWRAKF